MSAIDNRASVAQGAARGISSARRSNGAVSPLFAAFWQTCRQDEAQRAKALLEAAQAIRCHSKAACLEATELVRAGRADGQERHGVTALMQEYDLSSDEGVVLMCLAEALLRVPDADAADRLLQDKLTTRRWEQHLGRGRPLVRQRRHLALLLGDRTINVVDTDHGLATVLYRLVARLGEPVIRTAIRRAMGRRLDLTDPPSFDHWRRPGRRGARRGATGGFRLAPYPAEARAATLERVADLYMSNAARN